MKHYYWTSFILGIVWIFNSSLFMICIGIIMYITVLEPEYSDDEDFKENAEKREASKLAIN
jgi:hypothetical protein